MEGLESIRSIARRFMAKFEGTPMEFGSSPVQCFFPSSDEGWMEWDKEAALPELSDCMIEVRHTHWKKSKVQCAIEIHFETNHAGMYWRKTGLYKQREEDERVQRIADKLLGRSGGLVGGAMQGSWTAQGVSSMLANYVNSLAQQRAQNIGRLLSNVGQRQTP